jgi:hypothetical protein
VDRFTSCTDMVARRGPAPTAYCEELSPPLPQLTKPPLTLVLDLTKRGWESPRAPLPAGSGLLNAFRGDRAESPGIVGLRQGMQACPLCARQDRTPG